MHTNKTNLPALLAVAFAGAASMATSPADDGRVSTQQLDLMAPIPSFALSAEQPEAVFELQVTGIGSSTVAGQLTAEIDLESDVAVEVIATIETDESTSGQFSRAPVDGSASTKIDGMILGQGALRIRMLGSGHVTGGGTLFVSISVPIGTDTSTSAYAVRVAPR